MTLFRPVSAAAALAILAFSTLPASPAPMSAGKPSFDGAWSVLIMTEKGTCDRAYRYPVKIENGAVGYAGSASFTVSGKVDPQGRRDGDRRARQPERDRHGPHVRHRWLGHLDRGFGRLLRHLDRRAPLLSFSLYWTDLQKPWPGPAPGLFLCRANFRRARCRNPAPPFVAWSELPAKQNHQRPTQMKHAQHSAETRLG